MGFSFTRSIIDKESPPQLATINLLLINPETKRRNIEFGQVAIKKMSNFSKKLPPSPLKKVLSSIIKKNS